MAGVDHVSHSQLQTWDKCPRQWEYRYVKKLSSKPSSELILGGAYHKALDTYFKHKIEKGEDMDVEDCLDAFIDEWRHRIKEAPVNWGYKNENSQLTLGLALVEEYIESTAPEVFPASSEETFVVKVSGVDFICIIDLQDINRVVIDHKTAGRPYQQRDVDKDLQASAAALVLNRGIVFQNHVAVKAKTPYIQIVKTMRVVADIEWFTNKVGLTVKLMNSGNAPPSVDSWVCSPLYCPYWDNCRSELTRKSFS